MKTPEKTQSIDPATLTNDEIKTCLDALLQRLDGIQYQCQDNFPIYSIGQQDQWRSSSGGSWVGGYWCGCWWLRAYVTGSEKDRLTALEYGQRLESKLSADTINRAMIFRYSAGLGSTWFEDPVARRINSAAAAKLAQSFDPTLNAIPLGQDMGGGLKGHETVSVDTLASVLQLLMSVEEKTQSQIARDHLDTLVATLSQSGVSESTGQWHSHASYQTRKLTPTDVAGNWSRGQAWAMLALSKAAYLWGEPYLKNAQQACTYWRVSRGRSGVHSIPLNRLDQHRGLDDPSALLISSLALLLVYELDNNNEHLQLANRQITAVIRSRYFSITDGTTHNAQHGLFWGCCMTTRYPDDQSLVESPWGLFFLLSCLAVLLGYIHPYDV